MADNGTHSAFSGAIAVMVYQNTSLPLFERAIIVSAASFVGHLAFDVFPHGHTKKMWKELISSALIIPIVLILSVSRGGLGLLALSCAALFWGNIFDVVFEISRILIKKKITGPLRLIAEKIVNFNSFIHWFTRSAFTEKLPVHSNQLPERYYKGKPVLAWKYGWYNLVSLILGLVALYASFVL